MHTAVLAFFLFSPELTAEPAESRWREVANRLVTTPVEAYPFDWGEGVQMIGLMKTYERTGEAAYLDYVEKWARRWTGTPVDDLLNVGANAQGPRPGYCGRWSPATAILMLYQHRPKPEYLRLAQGVTRFIRAGAERNPADGALGHWQGSHQLWVDTLYMACPLLSALGQRERDARLVADAANQILSYAKPLQDSRNGLFYHMWDWQTRQRSPSLWGRGNGWVIMSIADTMEVLSSGQPQYSELRRVAGSMAAGLRATQDGGGLWHTVLDDTASYPESSATAMCAYGLLKLVRLGVLNSEDRAAALKAYAAVTERYVRDGQVSGASAGTDPGGQDHYKKKPVGTQTWGTGAYLMAGSEVDRLPKSAQQSRAPKGQMR